MNRARNFCSASTTTIVMCLQASLPLTFQTVNGPFSTVATFIALGHPNLQQDPNATTQFLLAQISQQLANATITASSFVQGSYVPPTSVVFINSVWLLSLATSLTSALMATLLRQWAHGYLQIVQQSTHPFTAPRAIYFPQGLHKFGFVRFAETMSKNMLVRILHWLTEDDELEEFVAGVPGLYESEAFTHNGDEQGNVRTILAVLPGLTGSRESLAWNIIQLAQRASTNKLPKPVQQRRTRACLVALFYIPGAIRDMLVPYSVGKYYCLEILPPLNSPESLEIIADLWDSPNDDVALSVRCVAAVVAAFMITPPRNTLDADNNVVCFLMDIKDRLGYMNTQLWTSDNARSILRERRGRASPAFVPAAQQDLITLTLERLARDPVTSVATSQHEAFCAAYTHFEQVALTQACEQARQASAPALAWEPVWAVFGAFHPILELLAQVLVLTQVQALVLAHTGTGAGAGSDPDGGLRSVSI
ncbi:hypothetical protein EDB85DRAFT_2292725 [Lactarius pseudohatsudake]|nr:hypothetical protein EDB85DRAFT_2292725 [Lactarius pseudohatsudake]